MPAPGCITNEDLWGEVQGLKSTTREILSAIKGNSLGTEGILPRLEKVEDKQRKHDRKMIKFGGTVVGVTLTLAALKEWIFSHKP